MDLFWGSAQERPDDTVMEVTPSPYYMAPFFGCIRFAFETPAACMAVHSAVSRAYKPLKVADSFAFLYKPPPDEYGSHHCPACNAATDEETEFLRQGLDLGSPSCAWRRSDANREFGLVSTYPRMLVVPRSVADESLAQVAQFRGKRRVPVLSWRSKYSGATITRGSQPMVGLLSYRSADDEGLIEAIRIANDPSKPLYILDSRPQTNGVFNRAMGGGYENTTNYAHCTIEFLNMPNIHTVRESFLRLRDTCGLARFPGTQTSYTWLSQLAASGWYDNLRLILAGVGRIVLLIERERASVFVHCSDSWDRTAQLCSLAELCMDPYYRTMHGFAALVEKEWLRMGHKFRDRLRADSLASAGPGVYEASPVFLQFIECVWQLTRVYPRSFEFGEEFLLAIIDEAMLGRFGTFLCNNDKERAENSVLTKTPQLWPYLLSSQDRFRNPFYREPFEDFDDDDDDHEEAEYEELGTASPIVIEPRVEPHLVQFWFNLYRRFFEGATAVSEPSDVATEGAMAHELQHRVTELEAEIARLRVDLASASASVMTAVSAASALCAAEEEAVEDECRRRRSGRSKLTKSATTSRPLAASSSAICVCTAPIEQPLAPSPQQQQRQSGTGNIMVAGLSAFTISDYSRPDSGQSCNAPRDFTGDEDASQEWVRLSRANSVSESGQSTPQQQPSRLESS